MKIFFYFFLITFYSSFCFSDGGGLPPNPFGGGGSSSYGGVTLPEDPSAEMKASLDRFDSIITNEIGPRSDRVLDMVQEAVQPKNLFLAGFATTAGAVLGGAVINGVISGLGDLTTLLMTDWDQIRANVYFDNLDRLWTLRDRLKKVEDRYSEAIRSYNHILRIKDRFSEDEMRDYIREMAIRGSCNNGLFSQSTFTSLMSDGERVLRKILFPEELRQQICDFLMIRLRLNQQLEDAKSKIIINFDSMAEKEIENFEEQQRDRDEAYRDSFLGENISEYTDARRSFISCLKNNPLRAQSKFSRPPYVDERGNPVDLISYWNQKFSVRPEHSSIGPVLSQSDYSKLKRGSLRTPPGGRAPFNMIFLEGPRSSDDIEDLRCPYNDPSTVPILGALINLFKDVNEECEELRSYFVEATNGEQYCQRQAVEGFESAERIVESRRDESRGQAQRDVARRRAEIERSRRIVGQWAREGYNDQDQNDRLISEEWDAFNRSACFR